MDPPADAEDYMDGIAPQQTGKVGDITAGLPPVDYVNYPYIEWYSDENGRVVIELEPVQVEVIGTPIPACESDPISREQQKRNEASKNPVVRREGIDNDLFHPVGVVTGRTAVAVPFAGSGPRPVPRVLSVLGRVRHGASP
ncbi:MAG: hypothetical protein NTZ17_18770 [Phycisphaerae bacterium]|nr:hypothetical protein [Phycisphaerae bacterium]